ncbi:MAG: lytic transglycosylase domain-containing protein [Bacilli bacterium]|nr:lytic transglycosylase domain-containing protein [Bacilli bacterium]
MHYIDFYYNKDNKLVAKINNNNKYKKVTGYRNLKKLIKICKKYGYDVDNEGIIEKYSYNIINDYEQWYNSKKKYDLEVTGNIKPNMKLNRKNIALRKRLTATGIAVIIAVCGASALQKQISGQNSPTTQYETQTTNNKETNELNTTEKQTNKEHKETKRIHNEKKNKLNTDNKKELNDMLSNKTFHFSYEDRTNNSNMENAKKYEHKFKKYAKKYGLDKNLLMAIAAQESAGDHYNNLNNGPAEGIMQIEKAVHIGETISAYNYETKQNESVTVSRYNLQDLDTNIRIGAMILRQCIDNTNCNIPLAVQKYNFGPGNINKVLNTCSQSENIPVETLENDSTNTAWLNYRAFLNTGDKEYVEHVFSYLDDKSNIKVLDKDGNEVSITINNDKENSKQM